MTEKMGLISVYKKSLKLVLTKPKFLIITLIPVMINLLLQNSFALNFTLFYDSLQPALFSIFTSGDLMSNNFLDPLINAVTPMINSYLIYFGVQAATLPLVIASIYTGTLSELRGRNLSLGSMLKKGFSKLKTIYPALLLITLLLALPLTLLLLSPAALILIPFIESLLLLILFYTLPAMTLEKGSFRQVFSYAWFVGRNNLWRSILYLILSIIALYFINYLMSFLPSSYNKYGFQLIITPLLSVSHSVLYLQGVNKR